MVSMEWCVSQFLVEETSLQLRSYLEKEVLQSVVHEASIQSSFASLAGSFKAHAHNLLCSWCWKTSSRGNLVSISCLQR